MTCIYIYARIQHREENERKNMIKLFEKQPSESEPKAVQEFRELKQRAEELREKIEKQESFLAALDESPPSKENERQKENCEIILRDARGEFKVAEAKIRNCEKYIRNTLNMEPPQ